MVNLGFNLVVELADFVFEVVNLEFIQHHDVVISVLAQQALEANRTQIVFTESFDVLVSVDFAFC